MVKSKQSMAMLGAGQPDIRRCKECMPVIGSYTFRARPKRESECVPIRTLAICFLVAGARSQAVSTACIWIQAVKLLANHFSSSSFSSSTYT